MRHAVMISQLPRFIIEMAFQSLSPHGTKLSTIFSYPGRLNLSLLVFFHFARISDIGLQSDRANTHSSPSRSHITIRAYLDILLSHSTQNQPL